ncbi:MAG TPA: hypothetical protein VGR15_00865, partial [Bacteroidota bacterium]|nr:hypothetical protein [Bacteroidota bacterium]
VALIVRREPALSEEGEKLSEGTVRSKACEKADTKRRNENANKIAILSLVIKPSGEVRFLRIRQKAFNFCASSIYFNNFVIVSFIHLHPGGLCSNIVSHPISLWEV